MLILALVATLLLGAFYSWTSRINGMFFFGRTVNSDVADGPVGRGITRRYRIGMLSITCGACLLDWTGSHLGHSFAATGLLGEVAGFLVTFAWANRRARVLQDGCDERLDGAAVVQVELLEPPSYSVPSLGVTVIPALMAMAAWILAVWNFGPEGTWSVHLSAWSAAWGSSGLDTILGMACGVLFASTGMLLLFRRSARLRTRMARYTVRASVCMQWIGLSLLLTVLFAVQRHLKFGREFSKALILVALGATFAVLLWNQLRVKRFVPAPVEMGADDRWRCGLFYVDRGDPALFVQSRCGTGYSLNYGRMLAWPIALGFVGYFVGMLFLTPHIG